MIASTCQTMSWDVHVQDRPDAIPADVERLCEILMELFETPVQVGRSCL